MSEVLEQPHATDISVKLSYESSLIASFMVAYHKSSFDAVHDSFRV